MHKPSTKSVVFNLGRDPRGVFVHSFKPMEACG